MRPRNHISDSISIAAVLGVAALVLACEPPTPIPVPDAAVDDRCPEGYVYIPEGEFEMGMNEDDPTYGLPIVYRWDMGPRRTVRLSAYCIQKTEATVGSFRQCRNAGICTAEIQDRYTVGSCNYSEDQTDRDRRPMNCITRQAARQYCRQWQGGDLPSDAQWEKAARSTDSRLFPWGNTMIACNRANIDGNGPGDDLNPADGNGCEYGLGTLEVGSLPAGDSPYGLKDMVGNVEELVLECFGGGLVLACGDGPCVDPVQVCDEDGRYATRGGSYDDYIFTMFVVASHSLGTPLSSQLGFRCVQAPMASGPATSR